MHPEINGRSLKEKGVNMVGREVGVNDRED
jgi:hypothetical protein